MIKKLLCYYILTITGILFVPTMVFALDKSPGISIFDFDSHMINDVSRIELEVPYLLAVKGDIIIRAHTDSIGTEEYNQKLSERRAQSVVNYFISKGIDPKRLRAIGMGENSPVADNRTKEGRAANRRVEIEYTL